MECHGNVNSGAIVDYFNVDIDLMKKIAMKTVIDGDPVCTGAISDR